MLHRLAYVGPLCGIAPQEPEETLDVPVGAVFQDQPEGGRQVVALTGEALVLAEVVGRPRSPGELGDPYGRGPVGVVDHRRAELGDPLASLLHVAGVWVHRGDVEVLPGTGHPVEVAEEGPGLHVPIGEQSGQDDLGIRVRGLDRAVGVLKEHGVLRGRWRGREVSLQVGLVPDLPGLDRHGRARARVVLPVLVGPVGAAGPVARHRGLQEVPPRLPVAGAVDRGPGDVPAADPRRRPPHEGDRPDSARGKAADHQVVRRPAIGAPGWLHDPPGEQEAVRLDSSGRHPLAVLGVERRP